MIDNNCGKTVASLILGEILSTEENRKYNTRVMNIMMDMRDGLLFVGTAPNRRKYAQFWDLWMAEIKTRIINLNLPTEIHNFALSSAVGVSYRYRRKLMLEKGWATKRERREFVNKEEKHGLEYDKRKAEMLKKLRGEG